MNKKLAKLPPVINVETANILKHNSRAMYSLGRLNGIAQTIPNQAILINTLPLLEAKESSAIENIITTHDELYKESLFENIISNPAVKEIQNYNIAIKEGFKIVTNNQFLSINHIIELQSLIVKNKAGIRKLPGTVLKNEQTGQIVYTPPQDYNEIMLLLDNLEKFINDDTFFDAELLVKMALIHYQFESIHPFYDGNGRIGRIINVLYLILKGLLNLPILYLSRYIIKNKTDYYRLLQEVRENNSWEDWIVFILKGVEETSEFTIKLIENIKTLMQEYKHKIRNNFNFYSQDLLNNLFSHPYTK
ncbi:MAG: Fic family protein, partial [Bacteroidales bacterium]|nr:Fic family protein [Bacteroidales bacterium]